MITEKIKALFQFIEFLHSNIDNFKQYDNLINELILLKANDSNLKPRNNFQDKVKHDEIQAEINSKFEIIDINISQKIKARATELNICDLGDFASLWNRNITEIETLKEKFSNEDLPEIFKHKGLYLEYRENTHKTFLSLDYFFSNLDEIFNQLFSFFSENGVNDFKSLERKTISVSNLKEAWEIMQDEKNIELLPELEKLKSQRCFYKLPHPNYLNLPDTTIKGKIEWFKQLFIFNDMDFKNAINQCAGNEMQDFLNLHLDIYTNDGGEKSEWISHTKDLLKLHLDGEKKLIFNRWITSNEIKAGQNFIDQSQDTGNDFTLSTIEDYLIQFKGLMSDHDYSTLLNALDDYFKTGMFPKLQKTIQVIGKFNKKSFGWALNELFASQGKGVEKELLLFAKQNISLYKGFAFNEKDYFKSNLYKYFTTKTK